MLLSSWNWTQCSQPVRSRSRLVLNFINPKQGTCLVSNLALVPQRRNFAIWQRVLHRDRSESRPKNTVLSSVSISLGSDLKACFSASSNSRIFWRMGDSISQEVPGLKDTTAEERPNKIKLTDEEWKAKLSPEEYSVCRRHGTERAWTGALLENKKKGVYTCSCCGVELFSSSAKFDSGSGWPSFYDAMKDKDVSRLPAVDIKQDNSYGMMRTEVLCGKCSSHLGHVFNDGPKPTGLRYCINSVSLKFKAEKGDGGEGTSNRGTSKNNL